MTARAPGGGRPRLPRWLGAMAPPAPAPPGTRPARWRIALVFAWALLLRLIYVHQISSNPYFDSPTMDPLFHDQWARAIAAGKPWLPHEPYFRAPLYPYFLAFVYRFLSPGYMAVRVVQAILGSASAVLVYLIGRRTFGERAGLLAGLLAGAYWMLIYFDGELLINVFENLFNLLFLWLVLRAAERDRLRAWFPVGLALGLSAIARPTILAFIVVLVPWMAWMRRDGLLARVAAVVAGAAIVILPVTARNLVVAHDFVPIAWQGGINFYLGNHGGANGWSAQAPELPLDWWGGYNATISIPEKAAGHPLKRSAVDRYWFHRGLGWMRAHPGAGAALMARKFALFWTSFEFGNNQDVYFFRRYSALLRGPLLHFGLVAPLALAGMLLFTRGAKRALLTLFVLLYMATIVAFFVCDKLRLPVVPLLIIFAAALVVAAWDALRARRLRALTPAALVAGLFAIPVNLNLLAIPHPDFAQSHVSVASVLVAKKQYAGAERELREAIAINPQFPSAHLNLGVVLAQEGHVDEAIAEYRAEIATGRGDPRPAANLGYLLQQKGDTGGAIAAYQEALSMGSTDLEMIYNLGGSLVRAGRPAEAEPFFRQVIAAQPDNVNAENNLAVALSAEGRRDEAIAGWEAILAKHPDAAQVRANLDAARRDRDASRN